MRPRKAGLIFLGIWMLWFAQFAFTGVQELIEGGSSSDPTASIIVVMWLAVYPVFLLSVVLQALWMQRLLREIFAN